MFDRRILSENKTTRQIIAKGLVMGDITDASAIILITEGRAEHWLLPEWMRPYIGKRIVISEEE